MDRLAGIRAKLDRANETIASLHVEIEAFVHSQACTYRTSGEFEGQSGEYVVKVYGEPAVPIRFAVLAGEVVHHLRSALDHLVVALVLHANVERPHNRHQFPVCRKADKFKKSVENGDIRGIPPTAFRRIADAQPYHQAVPGDHFLAVLHYLDIVDKHRILLVFAGAAMMGDKLDVNPGESGFEVRGLSVPALRRMAEGGVEIVRLSLNKQGAFEARPDVTVQVAFEKIGSVGPIPVIQVLAWLSAAVREFVYTFEPEFG